MEIISETTPLLHRVIGLDRKSQGMTLGLSRFRGFCNGNLGSELYTVATFRLGQGSGTGLIVDRQLANRKLAKKNSPPRATRQIQNSP